MMKAFMNRMIVTLDLRVIEIWCFIQNGKSRIRTKIVLMNLFLSLKRLQISHVLNRMMWNRIIAPLYNHFGQKIAQEIERGDASEDEYLSTGVHQDTVFDQYEYAHTDR